MRSSREFPAGFGCDPTMLAGGRIEAFAGHAAARQPDAPAQREPEREPPAGPRPQWPVGDVAAPVAAAFRTSRLETAHPHPVRREPPSVIVTAAFVGILLAILGYFLDVH